MFDFDKSTGEMFIYDDIGPSWMGMIDASTVINAMRDYSGRMTVRINSAGGSVDEAIAIYNALERHAGGVDVAIDSLAASAASYIAMAGQKITISDGGMIMIHSPWTIALGNSTELRKTADVLDKYEERIKTGYKKRMKLEDAEMSALLAEETWYNATEAVAAGLADETGNYAVDPVAIAEGRFMKTPKSLLRGADAGSRHPYSKTLACAMVRLAKIK
jgi:ATP-dependent protease ClpP protease subunit